MKLPANWLQSALLGTRQAHDLSLPDDALAPLLQNLNLPPEQQLLAGAAAYAQAAAVCLPAPSPLPPPAQDPEVHEATPLSLQLQACLHSLFTDPNCQFWLPETLKTLAQQGRHLPWELLPTALEQISELSEEAQRDLFKTLGARGQWLASQHPSASKRVYDPDAALESTLWNSAPHRVRLGLLAQWRAHAPARLREWLGSTWAHEKAEHRAQQLAQLRLGLGPADQPLLEQALSDRSKEVRRIAADLLYQLPESPLAQRMAARLHGLMRWEAGKLELRLPEPADVTPAWQQDQLRLPAQASPEMRQQLLNQLLLAVPVRHWCRELNPLELWKQLQYSPWAGLLETSFCQSVVFHADAEAAQTLLSDPQGLLGEPHKNRRARISLAQSYSAVLLGLLTQSDREAWLLKQMTTAPDLAVQNLVNGVLESPWSPALTEHVWHLALAGLLQQRGQQARQRQAQMLLLQLGYCGDLATLTPLRREIPDAIDPESLDTLNTHLLFRSALQEALL